MQRKLLFPPRQNQAGRQPRHKGRQAVGRDTVNDNIRIERIYWWSEGDGRDETLDQVLGIVADQVSLGVRQMCAQVGITQSLCLGQGNAELEGPDRAGSVRQIADGLPLEGS